MSIRYKNLCRYFCSALWLSAVVVAACAGIAQTTTFSYQGTLTDSGAPANGMYDIQFKLFDTPDLATGIQRGPTITMPTVQVTNGAFSVQLDFGAPVFDGSLLYLEIGIRPAGVGDPYTVLGPRQQITATPYAIRSLSASTADNATQLDGVPASGFIQNSTSQQIATSFNISGDGILGGGLAANEVNAVTQYKIGGSRVLSIAGAENLFVGVSAGQNNVTGIQNAFFGFRAGEANTSGNSNSFYGHSAGKSNTEGTANSFFGRLAGVSNTTGGFNAFFGLDAGFSNTTGGTNSYFGVEAGASNTTGFRNSFFGGGAGNFNTTGFDNSFFGVNAGISNTEESQNTFIGSFSNGTPEITNATAIGHKAKVTQSNSLVLGSINGVNFAEADTKVGIGTTAPSARLHVERGNIYVGTAGQGVILKSPDGATCRMLAIDNSGNLVTIALSCP